MKSTFFLSQFGRAMISLAMLTILFSMPALFAGTIHAGAAEILTASPATLSPASIKVGQDLVLDKLAQEVEHDALFVGRSPKGQLYIVQDDHLAVLITPRTDGTFLVQTGDRRAFAPLVQRFGWRL